MKLEEDQQVQQWDQEEERISSSYLGPQAKEEDDVDH
jgi:hypothetical protein